MNRIGMYLLCALLLSGATKPMAAAQITFDNVDGHYLAQVYAAVQTGGHSTLYNGYVNNYGSLPIGNANFGSALPGGLFPTTAGFMDLITGNLGVSGSSPLGLANDYSTVSYASFSMAVQFNQAGRVSFAMHEKGFVSAYSVNPPSDYAYASMQTSVAIVDNSTTNNTGASSVGTTLCISRSNGVFGIQCSTPLSVNQDFVATLDVVPGHVYTLSASESGLESSYGIFDGIDPVSLSLQLSPGLSIVPVDGTTLPGFIGGQASVPEPGTIGLFLGGLAVIGVARVRRARKTAVSLLRSGSTR